MAVFNNILAGASGQAGGAAAFTVERSLRFNSADSAYLNRTPSSAGNRKTWTFSCWAKRSKPGAYGEILLARSGTPWFTAGFLTNDLFGVEWTAGVAGAKFRSIEVFRDFSAWYHVVIAFDTTEATDSNRLKVWINNSLLSNTGTGGGGWPSLNTDYQVNSTILHGIGGNVDWSDQYLADVNFVDGQALTPGDFAETDATTGVWQPKAYSGTYGTNGFHLPFSDNSTAAALGTDTSGNGNDWTVNNLSITEGTGRYIPTVTGTPYSANYGFEKMFNGDTSNAYLASGSTTTTWTPSTAISFTTFRVNVLQASGSSTMTFNWSGGSYNLTLSTSNASPQQWVDVSSNVTSPITSISWTTPNANGPYVYAWEVDGAVLVDYSFGYATDSLRDSPTNGNTANDTGAGGEVPGNYATLNPLDRWGTNTAPPLQDGNLWLGGNGFWEGYAATIEYPTTGKWYFEATFPTPNSIYAVVGFGRPEYMNSWSYSSAYQVTVDDELDLRETSVSVTADYGARHDNEVVGIAVDRDANTYEIFIDGVGKGSRTIPFTAGTRLVAHASCNSSVAPVILNFGQRPFANTNVPSGYKCLCTANLPDPTIADGSTAMDVKLYTGTGSTQTISGLGFSPDLVWIKARSAIREHRLTDVIRGTTKALYSNAVDPEVTETGGVTAFNSDGFSVGSGNGYNATSETHVAWTWDAGSSTVTLNPGDPGAGSITSQVRANASAGFSIVTYTGTGSNASVGHGLGVFPGLIIIKGRDTTFDWRVWHPSFATGYDIQLNQTTAVSSAPTVFQSAPTSSVINLGTGAAVNQSTKTYVAYCWAPVEGYSAFGSYTGNGSSDGPFVYTGHRSRWLLVKCSSAAGAWILHDTARTTYNVMGNELRPDDSTGEYAVDRFDIVSNGFKVRSSNATLNSSGATYIYCSFAENPFKYARAR